MIKPLGERVIVKREKEQNNTRQSGIVLPTKTDEKSNIATVVEVGPGTKKEDGTYSEMLVKKGDRVLLNSYAGNNEITYEDEEYLIVEQNQILAIIEED